MPFTNEDIELLLTRVQDAAEAHRIRSHPMWQLDPTFRLKWDDVKAATASPGFSVVCPQDYLEVELLGDPWVKHLYMHEGDAVCGSGADIIIVVRDGLDQALEKLVKAIESGDIC